MAVVISLYLDNDKDNLLSLCNMPLIEFVRHKFIIAICSIYRLYQCLYIQEHTI